MATRVLIEVPKPSNNSAKVFSEVKTGEDWVQESAPITVKPGEEKELFIYKIGRVVVEEI